MWRPQATFQLNQTARHTAAPVLPGTARLPRFRDVLPGWTSLRGRALGAQKSSTLHNGPGRGERSILISQATGEFQQCTFERLTDFLEYNAPSCCQAFMVMLHSVEEWWISAAMELDELHVRPAAGGAAAKSWPGPNLAVMGGAGSQGHVVL